MMPNYLVIGAPKCGTSSLCNLLGQHPDAFMSEPKEIHFFGRDDPKKTLAWYESHFEGAAGKRAVGEGSTSYTHPDIIHRCVTEIADKIPDCRLIYMVRHPIKRLESDWKMRAHEGWSKGQSVNDAVDLQPTLITHGEYWKNINVYRERFSDEQILIVFLEDFSKNPDAELARCFTHIGVRPSADIRNAERPRNAASDYSHDRALGRLLRSAPLFDVIRERLPPWVVKAVKGVSTESREYTVEWNAVVRARVTATLQEDANRLLDFCGKPSDYWKYS